MCLPLTSAYLAAPDQLALTTQVRDWFGTTTPEAQPGVELAAPFRKRQPLKRHGRHVCMLEFESPPFAKVWLICDIQRMRSRLTNDF